MTAGKVALVTGASRGLGKAIALRLGAEGCAVAVNYRNSVDLAQSVVSSIVDHGGTAASFAADVTDEQSVADMIGHIHERFGSVDIVVANATGPQLSIDVVDITWDALLDQLNFFAKSPTLLLNAVLPRMKERSFGRFIHIGSEVVDLVPVGSAAYVCAKTAQRSLARSWAKELAQFGITVNTVSPGWVPVERHADLDPSIFEAYSQDRPIGRMGVPEDVAHAVAFLSSDSAEFITGINLTVNGGKTVD